MKQLQRIGVVVLLALPVIFAALWTASTEIVDGSFFPWRPLMIDLDVYRRAAHAVMAGKDFYVTPAKGYPFIYPPFGALLTIPFAVLPKVPTQIWWTLFNAGLISAMVYRLGFSGWRNSLLTTAAIWFIQPFRVTLGFGQVNIALTALVLCDLFVGPRLLPFRRRLLPQGWLTGIATAIKLTPALFAVYLFLSGKVRAALVTFVSFCAATAIGFAVFPGKSLTFWSGLLHGNSGINAGLAYVMNQSAVGVYLRFSRIPLDKIPAGGLLIAAAVAALGVAAAVLWHRTGEENFAISLAGLAGLLASPIAWSHHFIWALPLGVIALKRNTGLPLYLRIYLAFYVAWVIRAPFTELPEFHEMEYNLVQNLVDAGNLILGIILFVVAIAAAVATRRSRGLPPLPRFEHDLKRAPAPAAAETPEHAG